MANYNVDIAVALKGAQKLTAFNKDVKTTQLQVEGLNKSLKNTAKDQNLLVKSVNNVNAALAASKANLNEVALGTDLASKAAKEYLTALKNTNAALAEQKAAVVSLQNARKSDAFFLAQGARAGKQNRLDEIQSQAISAAIARENNIRIQAELKNQELLKEVQTRAPRLPAFQDRGLERLEDEFKKKKELKILEENANKASQRRLNFQEKQNAELNRQKELGIGINKNEKLINASFEDRVKFAEKNGKIRRQALIRANNLVLAEKKITEQRAKQNQTTAAGGSGRRIGSTISSAAIGGAFPLLFGQTGAAAVGGGIGGLAGGAIGGQFGFALSIVGTAIGSAIDQSDKFNASLASLDFAFKQAGDASGFTKDRLNELKATLGLTKNEAMAVATSFSRFGEAGSNAAFLFGKNPNTMKNLAAIVDTKTAMAAILDVSNGLTIQQQIQLLQQGKISSFAQFQFQVNKAIIEQNFARQVQEAEQIKNAERVRFVFSQIARLAFLISTFGFSDIEKMFPDLFKTAAERSEDRVNKLRDALKQFETDLPVLQDLMKDFSLEMEGMTSSIPMALDSVQRELRKLMSVSFMVTTSAQTIGDAFGESFKGIVKGTMTAQDALRNLFSRTADAFLDMAAQMIAKQIQMKILGIGLNFAGGLFSGGGSAGANNIAFGSQNLGINTASNFSGFADGGRPPVGRASIVGERGPELFVPDRAGTIIPNNAMGSSTNIVINVDASGSSVEGDEGQANQFGNALASAIQAELINQKRAGGLLSNQ